MKDYLIDWARALWRGWDGFWFKKSDPTTLGLIRILGGALLLYTHLVWSLDLVAYFGPRGWVSPGATDLVMKDSYVWSYFWGVHSTTTLWALHIAALIVFAALTLGLFTRVTSVLAAIATLSYAGRLPPALFGLDQINILIALYLAVGPSGAALSLDRLIRRSHELGPPPPSVGANIAIRLMQIHLCIIYLFAGTSKLVGPAWWNGTAMWSVFANLEYQTMDLTWLAGWPRVLNFLTQLTVAWEISYCALVWPARTRPIVLLLALPMHLGIGLCLGMATFGLAMLIANLSFVPPELVRAALRLGRRGATDGSGRTPEPAAGMPAG